MKWARREGREEREGRRAPRFEQNEKAVDQLEGERGEVEKQREEWEAQPGGQPPS